MLAYQPTTLQIDFERVSSQIKQMAVSAHSVQVQCEGDAEKALSYASEIRQQFKKIESTRKELTEPYRKMTAAVNDKAKIFTDKLKEIETTLIQKVEQWKISLRLKAVQEQAEMEELAAVFGYEALAQVKEPISEIRAEGFSSFEKTELDFEVVDIDIVPKRYLMIDKNKVQTDLKNGVRQIPGLTILQLQKTVLRTR